MLATATPRVFSGKLLHELCNNCHYLTLFSLNQTGRYFLKSLFIIHLFPRPECFFFMNMNVDNWKLEGEFSYKCVHASCAVNVSCPASCAANVSVLRVVLPMRVSLRVVLLVRVVLRVVQHVWSPVKSGSVAGACFPETGSCPATSSCGASGSFAASMSCPTTSSCGASGSWYSSAVSIECRYRAWCVVVEWSMPAISRALISALTADGWYCPVMSRRR